MGEHLFEKRRFVDSKGAQYRMSHPIGPFSLCRFTRSNSNLKYFMNFTQNKLKLGMRFYLMLILYEFYLMVSKILNPLMFFPLTNWSAHN